MSLIDRLAKMISLKMSKGRGLSKESENRARAGVNCLGQVQTGGAS